VAQAWAVTAAQAIAAAPDKLAFAFPTEGFPRFAITSRFCGKAAAPIWRISSSTTATSGCGCGDRRDHTHSNREWRSPEAPAPEIRDNPVLFPSAENPLAREWFVAQSSTSQRLRDRLWTEIKGS